MDFNEDDLWGHAELEQHFHSNGDRSDAKLGFEEICKKHGFAFESHEITTKDGYILTVYRIPGLSSEEPMPQGVHKPVVLM